MVSFPFSGEDRPRQEKRRPDEAAGIESRCSGSD